MKPDQKHIYYLAADSKKSAQTAPFLEQVNEKGFEVPSPKAVTLLIVLLLSSIERPGCSRSQYACLPFLPDRCFVWWEDRSRICTF